MRWLGGITNAMHMKLGKFREMGRDREAWCAAGSQRVRHGWTTEQQNFLGAKSSDLSQTGKLPTTLQLLSFHLCIPGAQFPTRHRKST